MIRLSVNRAGETGGANHQGKKERCGFDVTHKTLRPGFSNDKKASNGFSGGEINQRLAD